MNSSLQSERSEPWRINRNGQRESIPDACFRQPFGHHKRVVEEESLSSLIGKVQACRTCTNKLPHRPRPVLQISPTARILIASQAPGAKVHSSGIPFSDESGNRLREWTGLSEAEFYDASMIAIVPMALCCHWIWEPAPIAA